MGATAEATLRAVIDGYKSQEAETVLEQFHENVRVIGTKSHESWTSRTDVEVPLTEELFALESIGGPLTELTGLTAEDLAARIKPDNHENLGFGWLTEVGEVQFNGLVFNGRWSCVVQKDENDDWWVVQSHFSVAEPNFTPE